MDSKIVGLGGKAGPIERPKEMLDMITSLRWLLLLLIVANLLVIIDEAEQLDELEVVLLDEHEDVDEVNPVETVVVFKFDELISGAPSDVVVAVVVVVDDDVVDDDKNGFRFLNGL